MERLEQAMALYLAYTEESDPRPASEFLDQHEELRELLEPLILHESDAGASGGRVLGDYRLEREIGRGGMGVVYEAWQLSLQRLVAVKVLPAQITLHPKVVARFQREALMVARLDHPGIVAVHEVGSADGVHYFVMDLIDGLALDRLIPEFGEVVSNHLHGTTIARGFGPDRIEPDERGEEEFIGAFWQRGYVESVVDLGIQVADALTHAHAAGVLHRDVKPSNILVRRDGSTVLVDFGLARDVEGPSITATGEFAGTPIYASPEQVRSDGRQIDARSDVYSLGASLYQALTLHRPFDGESTAEVLDKISTSAPVDPQKLNPELTEDISAILLCCLEKEPSDRYSSAAALAADLRAFRAYRPVSARPPSRMRQLRSFARRNRVVVTGAMAVVIALSAGLVTSLLLYFESERNRLDAEHNQRVAEREAALATTVGDFLIDLLSEAIPETNPAARHMTVTELFERALERVEESFSDQPAVEAGIREMLARGCLSLGMYSDGIDQLQSLEFVQGDKKRTDPNAASRRLELEGLLMLRSGMLDGAVARLEGAAARLEPLDDSLLNEHRGRILNTLGTAYLARGDLDAADSAFRRSLRWYRATADEHGEQVVSANLISLAFQRNELESLRGRVDAFVESIRDTKAPDHPSIAIALNVHAALLRAEGDLVGATVSAREALSIRRRVFGANHPGVAEAAQNLGELLLSVGEFETAEALLREAVTICEGAFPGGHPTLATGLHNLGVLRWRRGDRSEAESLLRRSHEMRKRMLDSNHVDIATSASSLVALFQEDRPDVALPFAKEALAIRERAWGPDHPELAGYLYEAGFLVMLVDKDATTAERHYRRCLEICRAQSGEDNAVLLNTLARLAHLLLKTGRVAEAKPLAEESLAGNIEKFGPEHRYTNAVRNLLDSIHRAETAEK